MPSNKTKGTPVSAKKPSANSSKQKGSRSVSTLTPSQLARKHANDREAQRAIRARTKEHIERLEHEVEELRSHRNHDRALQDLLLRHSRGLEDKLSQLRKSMGMSMASSPYSAPVPYDGQQQHAPGTVSSPRKSPGAAVPDDTPLPNPGQHYAPVSDSSVHSWAAKVPSDNGCNVSSPSASADDYVSDYNPTSVPDSMMSVLNSLESRYDSCRNDRSMQPTVCTQQQYLVQLCQQNSSQGDWPMYPVDYNSQVMGRGTYVAQ